MIIEFDKLKAMVMTAFENTGMVQENARQMADVLVTAQARGIYSHGINFVPVYMNGIKNGTINPNPKIQVAKEGEASLVIDGDSGLGGIVVNKAVDMAVKKARESGSCTVGIVNCAHYGAGAYYVNRAAHQGMAAFLCANGVKSVVPFGGKKPYLGTNPYSFSVPAGKYGMVTLDMATTEVAASKLAIAAKENKEVRLGIGVDRNGQPTKNPKEILENGALCHFGGVKGYGISFMIHILTGILTGNTYKSDEIDLFGNVQGHPTNSFFMNVTDIEHFISLDYFKERIECFIEDIKNVEPAEGFQEVCYPGELENRKLTESLKKGIYISEEIYENFTDTCKRLS